MRALTASVVVASVALASCAPGFGTGEASGTVNVPLCEVSGAYDLHPNWFGTIRTGALMSIRIQDGGGPPEYTDHLAIQIDDAEEVARRLASSSERDAEGNPVVTLRVGLTGSPGVLVHATLLLPRSCGRERVTRLGQNVGLWAYDGTITFRQIDRGVEPAPGEPTDRLMDVTAFDFRLHDPRPIGAPTSAATPLPTGVSYNDPVGDAHITGSFRYNVARGVPSQPFYPHYP